VVDAIAAAAGRVWRYLKDNGEATGTRLAKRLHLLRYEMQRAIGWLSCEDKLYIEKARRVERIRLK
jgi:hypothetical protein